METRYVSAGGTYVSPRDYAKALLVVLKKGLHPDSDVQRFLSEDNSNEILTRRPNSKTYGLGVGTWGEHFQHNGALGSNYYTSGARFIADRSKQKAVIFASNQNGSSGPDWFVENALLGEGIDAYRRAFNF